MGEDEIMKGSTTSQNERERTNRAAESQLAKSRDAQGLFSIDISSLHTPCSFFTYATDFARFSFECRRRESFLRVLVSAAPAAFPRFYDSDCHFMGSLLENCTRWLFRDYLRERSHGSSMRYDP